MATNDYRQDQTSQERDQAIGKARQYGFQPSLGIEAPIGSLPEPRAIKNPWGVIPSSGVRANYATPERTHYPSSNASRTGDAVAGLASSRLMRRSKRGQNDVPQNIYIEGDKIGTTTVSDSTIKTGLD